jgi:serine/threonine-protein kinase RsbW
MKNEILDIIEKKQIEFTSKIENISLVEKLVDEISQHFNFSNEVYGNIYVAIIEAVNNAILHGNKLDARKKVTLNFEFADDFLIFVVSDEGPGFNFNKLPDPTLPENLEKPHGRGVFLMQRLSDNISYEKNGSVVKLKFKIK